MYVYQLIDIYDTSLPDTDDGLYETLEAAKLRVSQRYPAVIWDDSTGASTGRLPGMPDSEAGWIIHIRPIYTLNDVQAWDSP